MRPLLALAPLLVLLPASAWACAPLDPNRLQEDRPISVAPDGSFIDAAIDDDWTFLRGGRSRDLGGGRTGQVIERDFGCMVAQTLLFADCTTRETLAIEGLPPGPDDPADAMIARSTLRLQAPLGPLRLGPASTVAEVAALAAREGWETVPDVGAWAAERGERNRFDPFVGCRIFYPGSAGAGS